MLELGSLLIDGLRHLPEAERLIRRAIELDRREKKDSLEQEGDPAAYVDTMGRLLFRRGQWISARDWFERAANSPEGRRDPAVWDHLGDACERLGDRSAAVAAWTTARHLCPGAKRTMHDGRAAEIDDKIQQLKMQE